MLDQVKKGVPNEARGEPIMTPFEPVNDSGIYEPKCANNHKSKTVINNIDFEILYEYGLNAIADGYYREAVTSITSAMERYFEFFVKVVLHASGSDVPTLESAWKKISNQSERQLGAYIALYYQTFQNDPLLLINKDVAFRNAVIHKGYIPKRDESIAYANNILTLIESSLLVLKNKFAGAPKYIFETYGYLGKANRYFDSLPEVERPNILGAVNVLVTIDVMQGREMREDDVRKGTVENRLPDIVERRNPRRLFLIKGDEDEMEQIRRENDLH